MAGYIGAKQGVTQVDGYNRAEADAEFVQVTGDTMTGALAVNGNLTVDTNTLFVDAANNRVGIGTSGPQVLMHGQSSDARLWLERPSGSHIEVGAGASSAFVYNRANAPLLFGTNNTERVRISSDGFQRNNVAAVVSSGQESAFYSGGDGVGLYNANAYSGCGAHIEVGNDATSGWANIYLHRTWNTGEDTRQISFYVNGSGVGSIDSTTTGTSYNTSSDYRLKEDVQPMVGSIDRLMALKPVNFAWKVDGTRVDGFLAHEAQEVVPEAVTGTKDEVDDEGNPKYQGIDQSKLVPLLTAALQEALTKIDALEARIVILEGGAA